MTPMLKKILLSKSRGFCNGVKRSIKILNNTLEEDGPPIYARHAIVHNDYIVSQFKKRGVVFINDLNQIPPESTLILSAHGTAPKTILRAKKMGCKVIDAACPIVKRIHITAEKYHLRGYSIVYIGHKNTQEAKEITQIAPMQFVKSVADAEKIKIRTRSLRSQNLDSSPRPELKNTKKLICLTQTTLLLSETKKMISVLKKRFPDILVPTKGNVCHATQKRQDAVAKTAPKTDLFLIIGSKSSSNCNRLAETARQFKKPAYLINNYKEIKDSWLKNIEVLGLTSGASTPEILVQQTIDYLKGKYSGCRVDEDNFNL